MEGNSLFPPSQLSYQKDLGTYDGLLTLSHHIQVALDRGREERLVQLNFSAAFEKVSHRGLLYSLKSIGVRGQFLSIGSEFFNDKRQRVRLDGKVST